MAGALRKTMEYLGIAEQNHDLEAEYDEYEDEYDEVEESVMDTFDAQVTPIRRAVTEREEDAVMHHSLPRITTVHPRSYNDARVIGEAFRSGTPVIINLSDMDESDAKRLVDFSSGLIFGLNGSIERVTAKVFLLSPQNVEIAANGSDARDGSRQSFYNQS
ncbi:cell division protein SepF [Jonesia denitrificans]|uniref:Cell division protein SepF n=1 Tax=Jonesia denitrificans (strain ATCC 14870 / DSM 20603 / BCRC 15368 / CIP 55.134 / JCM 11481 / NBRC 15587 / NCTC 10816 / Prevot 55134) TaxID=471856 RepID=C7R3J9_JONDD|nr:cell division protein SepF [Jonesia denitrificans]ACV08735.1 protein of unknown function DUF552 [Jonesia denitrificans DSM 20603]ASE09940.1 cell division protein SepF [Jonesia denitrificans]QXB42274.1 cell division protein SepF [Jonesia denitrificans]SQH20724.1 Cell division protein SepF [Jonesia denitrificans]